jgi:hypothetical protein
MAKYVACDDCDERRSDNATNWFAIELSVMQNSRHKEFSFILCQSCYEKIVDPSPKGLRNRVLSFLNR